MDIVITTRNHQRSVLPPDIDELESDLGEVLFSAGKYDETRRLLQTVLAAEGKAR